jgi:hypothetical protein
MMNHRRIYQHVRKRGRPIESAIAREFSHEEKQFAAIISEE